MPLRPVLKESQEEFVGSPYLATFLDGRTQSKKSGRRLVQAGAVLSSQDEHGSTALRVSAALGRQAQSGSNGLCVT